jgi:FK506-binding protein 1
MSLGEKAKLLISSDMGYGRQGAGGVIPPNADLIFEVELLKIGNLAAVIPEEAGCCIIL